MIIYGVYGINILPIRYQEDEICKFTKIKDAEEAKKYLEKNKIYDYYRVQEIEIFDSFDKYKESRGK